jgi:hypothetical protein
VLSRERTVRLGITTSWPCWTLRTGAVPRCTLTATWTYVGPLCLAPRSGSAYVRTCVYAWNQALSAELAATKAVLAEQAQTHATEREDLQRQLDELRAQADAARVQAAARVAPPASPSVAGAGSAVTKLQDELARTRAQAGPCAPTSTPTIRADTDAHTLSLGGKAYGVATLMVVVLWWAGS